MGRTAPGEPPERRETVRRRMLSLLEEGTRSARELSSLLRVPEKEVRRHLPHVEKTLRQKGRRLIVEPAGCRKCGFVFRKRERFTKPSRCPVCRSESVEEPLFSAPGGEPA